jgi:DNA-binding transcriptional LysR family regulator
VSSSWPDLAVLELLVAIVETGSLAAAAERVGMSQPSASRAVT